MPHAQDSVHPGFGPSTTKTAAMRPPFTGSASQALTSAHRATRCVGSATRRYRRSEHPLHRHAAGPHRGASRL